jgi:hypothetical protein
MSWVRVRPHSSPIARARASNGAITQYCRALESWACLRVPRHTWARAALGTITSVLLEAASLSTAQMRRSLRSSAMSAPASRTIPFTFAAPSAVCARQRPAQPRRGCRARLPTRERRATGPLPSACAVPRPRATKTLAPCRPPAARRGRVPARKTRRIARQSYYDITADDGSVNHARCPDPDLRLARACR